MFFLENEKILRTKVDSRGVGGRPITPVALSAEIMDYFMRRSATRPRSDEGRGPLRRP